MPSNQAPQAARLSTEQLPKMVGAAGGEYVMRQVQEAADAAADKAYRVCRQEALEAAAGLEKATRTLRNEAVRSDLCDQASEALADWTKFKEAGNGD